MPDQDRPNLFHYATSELSQDAFICWLAAWADPKLQTADLHQMAREFIVSMIRKVKPDYDDKHIKTVDISRQKARIDVLIEINKNAGDKLAILIEDKTHTDFHSNQQLRYPKIVIEKRLYTSDQIIPIFFKTGYQSRFDNLGEFKLYLRKDFLEVLENGKLNQENAIYADFLAHLKSMESAVWQFYTKDPANWKDNDWRGFYMKLFGPLELQGANWGHVNNQSGGFVGFWWHGADEKFKVTHNYEPYLQLETPYCNENNEVHSNLCFKVAVKNKVDATSAWYYANERLRQAGFQLGIPLLIAKRAQGYSMTILRWDGDYRVSSGGVLDFNATLENLKKAQQVLDVAFPK